MRVVVGDNKETYGKPLKHDDIVVVPNFFCVKDDWSLYYGLSYFSLYLFTHSLTHVPNERTTELIKEMRESQSQKEKRSEWIGWHENCHLITKNPNGSKTFKKILEKTSKYFETNFLPEATRFNWYKDSSDWKPFHHDSAAFNERRAKTQNITVGVSFGSERELAFLNAKNGTRIYFPQTNGMLFAFGRDVNINWKHGINALPPEEHNGKGRISIVLWGLCDNVIEEDGSPDLVRNSKNIRRGNKENGMCRDFQRGRCNYGKKCKFRHDNNAGGDRLRDRHIRDRRRGRSSSQDRSRRFRSRSPDRRDRRSRDRSRERGRPRYRSRSPVRRRDRSRDRR